MFQDDNPGHGNPGDDLRPAALVLPVAEDRLDISGQEATHWRKKESGLCSGVPSGSQQPCAGRRHKLLAGRSQAAETIGERKFLYNY